MPIESLFIIGAVAVFLFMRKARSATNKHGTELNKSDGAKQNSNETKETQATFKVATFNIQTGKSLTGKRDISRSANVIKDVDLIGIQEVYAPSALNLLGIGASQTDSLASTGNFDWLFCATRRRWLREHRGNLLLSKLPITNWQIEMLPDQSGKSYRNMSIAKVVWKNQTFHFINTHLHTRQGREEQLSVVLSEFAKYPRAILVGDFNSNPNSPQLTQLLKSSDVSDAIGAMNIDLNEESRIDWILTKGFKIHNAKMLGKGISDHPYYEATLSII